jgi:hypothetical protein
VQEKQQAPYPQGMDRLMQFSIEALPATTGINLEMLGLADRQQAGVVESQVAMMARTRPGVVCR